MKIEQGQDGFSCHGSYFKSLFYLVFFEYFNYINRY